MKPYIIGIDPDTDKSGIALYNAAGNTLTVGNYTFFQLFEMLKEYKPSIEIVKVECGFHNKKSSWRPGKTTGITQKIAGNVGACNQVAKLIVQMCQHLGVPYKEMTPFLKTWEKGKVSIGELNARLKKKGIPPITTKTNQETRDATLMCIAGVDVLDTI
ncbi:hypothetical protein GCM10027051_31080 [Niabella terrae]